MKIVRIGASWCSSCLIMKSRFQDVIKDYDNIEIINYDYDFDEDKVEEYQVGDVLPVYIRLDNNKRIIGEKNKEEIEAFLGDE
mgnify:CR=1 FL=1